MTTRVLGVDAAIAATEPRIRDGTVVTRMLPASYPAALADLGEALDVADLLDAVGPTPGA